MIYLRLTESGIQYPYPLGRLPSDFPNTSFPENITEGVAQEFGCFPVKAAEIPDYDPRLQKLEELTPVQQDDGSWAQVITVRDATEEEIADYDLYNKPTPDWAAFKQAVFSNGALNQDLASALLEAPLAVLSLPSSFLLASEDRGYSDFQACWSQLKEKSLISETVQSQVKAAALLCNLPTTFQELL